MTELTKSEGTEVGQAQDLGLAGQLTHDDCERGRILVAQSNSTFLDDNEELRGGDIVEMSSMEKLGGRGDDMEFIIVDMLKYWVEKDGETKEFIRRIPAINEKELPWEEVVDGRLIKRVYHCSYVVLLPQDIADGLETPYELAFRSTSLKAAKRINSIVMKKGAKGVASYAFKFKMDTKKESKGADKTWYVPSIEVGEECSQKEIDTVLECRKAFSSIKSSILAETKDKTDVEQARTSIAPEEKY